MPTFGPFVRGSYLAITISSSCQSDQDQEPPAKWGPQMCHPGTAVQG
jgi:hypothetical protein